MHTTAEGTRAGSDESGADASATMRRAGFVVSAPDPDAFRLRVHRLRLGASTVVRVRATPHRASPLPPSSLDPAERESAEFGAGDVVCAILPTSGTIEWSAPPSHGADARGGVAGGDEGGDARGADDRVRVEPGAVAIVSHPERASYLAALPVDAVVLLVPLAALSPAALAAVLGSAPLRLPPNALTRAASAFAGSLLDNEEPDSASVQPLERALRSLLDAVIREAAVTP